MTADHLPPSVERVLRYFRAIGGEERMQALLQYARRLEPLPARFRDLDRAPFTVPECQTRADIFPGMRDGRLHCYADLDPRKSPTIAAFFSILFSAVNDQPPATTLAISGDFVRQVMDGIGLAARESGLGAILQRLKRYATDAAAAAR